MELVYLWVEDYKNIHQQGFNFSGRYRCDYDHEKNELTIDENKEYVSIFPENINVTAIVGENGSGKSGLLEFIRFALTKENYFINPYRSIFLFYEVKTEKFIALNLEANKITYNIEVEEILYQGIESFNASLKQCVFQTFNYSMSYNLSDYTRKQENVRRQFHFFPKKFPHIDLLQLERDHIKRLLINYHQLQDENNFEIFNDFFKPSKIQIFMKLSIEQFEQSLTSVAILDLKTLIEQANSFFESNHYGDAINRMNQFIAKLSNPISYMNTLESMKFPKLSFFEINIAETLISKNTFDHYRRNIIDGEFRTQLIFDWDIRNLQSYEIEAIVDSFREPFFTIEIIDDDEKKFKNLSFGEQQLLKTLNDVYYFGSKEYMDIDIKTVGKNDQGYPDDTEFERENSLNFKNFFIFFDEIEMGLHPKWQAQTINYMINFLKHIKNRNFHVILATHSPFILSDIPKKNILFLKDGKLVDVKIDTFGANIHTLLSHGFFMKDGLMGEFAKDKINKAINFLNKKQLSKDEIEYCENIISIIGEPILKRQLQKMLESKRLIKIDDISQKIKDMEYELSVLKKYQNKATDDELKDRAKRKYAKKKQDD